MEIRKVGVLGCGLMGSGIAQVSATAGFDVTVLEVDEKYIERGFAAIRKSLDKLAAKGTDALGGKEGERVSGAHWGDGRFTKFEVGE